MPKSNYTELPFSFNPRETTKPFSILLSRSPLVCCYANPLLGKLRTSPLKAGRAITRVVGASYHGSSRAWKSSPVPTATKPEQTPYLTNLLERGLYNEDILRHVQSSEVKELAITQDGQFLKITWGDNHVSTFDSIWLRHNCHCESCRLDHNGMISINFNTIDRDLRVTSATLEGDKVIVLTWEAKTGEKHHVGPIPAAWLRHYCYSEKADQVRRKQRKMNFHEEKTIPEVDFEDVVMTDKGLYTWLSQLSDRGISLVKNVPRMDGMVTKVAERIAPVQHTVYGEMFDVISTPEPINPAFSAVKLDLHMDQVHYESPPGLQLLHCIEFDPDIIGGDNTFADIHEIAHKLYDERPDLFEVLTKVPCVMHTVHYSRSYPVHIQIERPLFTVNHKKELVSVIWHPLMMGPLQAPESDVKAFYEAFQYFFRMVSTWESLYHLRMVGGDMITVNNRRVLHGRKSYSNLTSKRLLQGAYVEISEFQSRVQVFHNVMGGGQLASRCGSFNHQ